ncbi:MAG: hypothetical protein OEL89_05475 [Candidatus Peregrinibacteria bacterium]|nr:hypothetical protein [Candidatus Peregrinibacteria bacterium]
MVARKLHTGKRGGKYYLIKGKKVYAKSVPAPKRGKGRTKSKSKKKVVRRRKQYPTKHLHTEGYYQSSTCNFPPPCREHQRQFHLKSGEMCCRNK